FPARLCRMSQSAPVALRHLMEFTTRLALGERMPHVQYWARVRADQDCPLRRGAWYRVVELTPVEAIVDVNHRLLHIPRAFVQVLPLQPPAWTVVPGPDVGGAAGAGRKYGVCPSCCARARLDGPAPAMRCPRWGTLARARARALKLLAAAFGLRA